MGIAQAVDGYVVGPLILSKSVGLSSFWIIASVIIMGNIMGTTGMFLGVPIFAILKLIYTKLIKNKRENLRIKYEEEKENNEFKEIKNKRENLRIKYEEEKENNEFKEF